MPSNPYNPNILDARRQQYELEVDNWVRFKLLILLMIARSLLILLIGSNSTMITFQRTLCTSICSTKSTVDDCFNYSQSSVFWFY